VEFLYYRKQLGVKTLKNLFPLLLLALAAYGQQERIAIINTVDDGNSVAISDLAYLTNKLRETATNVLPKQRYGVMTTESIVAFLGSQERLIKECKAASCLAELGRKVSADYVAQARVGRFSEQLSINFELYNTKSGIMIGSFVGDSKDILGLLAIINEQAPILFRKMPMGLVVNIATEPAGAALSFDGLANASCPKTPCKMELLEGQVRILAALEQYETTDTTVSIINNNQTISLKLKPDYSAFSVPALNENIQPQNEEPVKSKNNLFWLALGLDLAGATFVVLGLSNDSDVSKKQKEYNNLKVGQPQNVYDNAYDKVESAKTTRNVFYALGGIFLAAGIGVHIWF